ncbi:hypothetical protein NMG60_11024426 [Bertholletia excelsa]
MSACSKIRHIVRLRQMLRQWRKKAAEGRRRIPPTSPSATWRSASAQSQEIRCARNVPEPPPSSGSSLSRPRKSTGFPTRALAIPCDESVFEEILLFLARSESGNPARLVTFEDFQRCCPPGNLDFWPESRPLLHGFTDKSIW